MESNSVFIVSLILGFVTSALTIFSIFFNYDEEKPVKLSRWGRIAIAFTICLAIAQASVQYHDYLASEVGKIKADSLQNALILKNDDLVRILQNFEGNTITGLSGIDVKVNNSLNSLASVSSDLTKSAENAASSITIQRELLKRQVALRDQILRAYYPLEPITILYETRIPMDGNPELVQYVKRIQKEISTYLRTAREGRGVTDDDLHSETVQFVLSNVPSWLPDSILEKQPFELLLRHAARFNFVLKKPKETTLSYNSFYEQFKDVIVHRSSNFLTTTEVTLHADFADRVFIQEIRCANPVRTGNDLTSLSSIDLIGRTLKTDPSDKIERVSIVFSYDYQTNSGFGKRWMELDSLGCHRITAKDVGLDVLLN